MAGKPKYTEHDKARVYVVLQSNDGNVGRTARDTGLPEATVRRWKAEFATAPPPSEEIDDALGEFLDKAESVQWKAIVALERRIDKDDVAARDLITIIGVLNDKITRAKGGAQSRVDHVHHLPSAEEIALAGKLMAQGAISAALERQAEIQESEEQPAIPARTLS